MYGLFKYEMGLQFTGIVAETKEKIIEYLNNKYAYIYEYKGERYSIPQWNKEAFKIKEIIKL